MLDSPPQATLVQYLSVLAAIIGIIGYAFFGWRFGGDTDGAPALLGIAFAVIAISWTLYQRR